MRVTIQRVSEASVTINGRVKSQIGRGLLVLAGFHNADTEKELDWMAKKLVDLRIFEDENGQMNKSVKEIDGEILIVSQFTLYASTKKGNRPSFIEAAKPDIAVPLYERFLALIESKLDKPVASGEFGADMKVALLNDGPVTINMDSHF